MLIKWKWQSSVLAFTFLSLSLQAQLANPVSYEVEVRNPLEKIHVISSDDDGILLFKNTPYKKFSLWNFIKLDSSLNEGWNQELTAVTGLRLGFHKTYKGAAYMMFTAPGSYNLQVIMLDLKHGYTSKYEIKNHIPLLISSLEITDDAILVGAAFKQHPLVLHFNRNTSKSHFLPNLFALPGTVNHIATNQDGSFDVVLSTINAKKNQAIDIYTYNPEGKMIEKTLLSSKDKKSLQNGRLIYQDEKKLIAGTYGRKYSPYSRGLYIAELGGEDDKIRYYNYADLTNFFNYMKENRARRIKDRIARRKEAGRKIRFNYMLQVHDIFKDDDNSYVMHAEAYYPRYRNYSSYNNGMPGGYRSAGYSNLIFDGYRYTHAIVVGFDSSGKIVWDNCLKLEEVESYTIDKVVNLDIEKGRGILYYNTDNTLHTKLINEGSLVEDRKVVDIGFTEAKGRKKHSASANSGVIKANDNSFYAYGVRKVKYPDVHQAKTEREVFFINKVIYK